MTLITIPSSPLNPGEQIWLDVTKTIRNQVPDKNGKTIPPDVQHGSYSIHDVKNILGPTLFEGKLTIDEKFGHASYGCGNCCDTVASQTLVPNPFTGGVGAWWQDTLWGWNPCTALSEDLTPSAYNWNTTNLSVTTVSQSGLSNARGVGAANTFTSIWTPSALRKCPYHIIQSSGGVTSYTSVQHNYPMSPLPSFCWISQFFDHVTNGKAHRAQDVVYSNSTDNGGIRPGYGTNVYAVEGGTVVSVATGNGPSAQGYPACVGQGVPTNYVKIRGSDGYFTVYVHLTPIVHVGDSIYQGQQIGVTDNSGCQSGGHVHLVRKDPSNNPVNFTIPCVNPLPKNSFADGLVNDDVPDNL